MRLSNKNYQWLTIITISLIVATLNIFHVIIGLAKTPAGYSYLATGHYYLDYFVYLQHIASGMAGHWLPANFFSTDDINIEWRFFPYILLGKIAWIFHLSPMTVYWLAVFILTALTLIGFYYLINLMLPKETFSIKIIAFLISIFSGPVYQIFINNGRLILNPYDFWYGPSSFIRRFEVVPYHALGLLLLILIIIFINKVWNIMPSLSKKSILNRGFWVAVLIIILMTFLPLALASLILALLIISAIYFIKSKNNRLKIFLFNAVLLFLIVPVAIILRRSSGYGGWSFEVNWISYLPWWFMLLNLGPIVLFFPFGVKEYLNGKNFLRYLLFIITLVSYGLYLSPVAYYLGIHNLRFFSSISYISYGVLTVLGIKKISSIFKKYDKMVVILLSMLLIFYSCFLTFYTLKNRLLGLDLTTPTSTLTYLPNPIIAGLQSLRSYPQANVLTGPWSQVGLIIPVFSYKKVFVGRPISTNNIENKQAISDLFYSGKMTENEAKIFLKTNKLNFVILTSLDNYDINNINHYLFLKPVFINPLITIWKVTENEPIKKS